MYATVSTSLLQHARQVPHLPLFLLAGHNHALSTAIVPLGTTVLVTKPLIFILLPKIESLENLTETLGKLLILLNILSNFLNLYILLGSQCLQLGVRSLTLKIFLANPTV